MNVNEIFIGKTFKLKGKIMRVIGWHDDGREVQRVFFLNEKNEEGVIRGKGFVNNLEWS